MGSCVRGTVVAVSAWALALMTLGALNQGAGGAELTVPVQYGSIQGAIDAASDGDVVIVSPNGGNPYYENIRFNGKAVTVRSVDPCDPCAVVIDGGSPGDPMVASVVTFWDDEEPNSVLDGFTITNGTGTFLGPSSFGGGIACVGASPTVRNCRIVGNTASQYGAGVYAQSRAVLS